MLSVVIATHESERVLLPTLSALIPGAVAGLVREVIVADAGSRDATAAVADAAGCRVLASTQSHGARLRAAAEVARAPWLFFLRPGVVLEPSWVEETRRFTADAERRRYNYAAVFCAETFRPSAFEAMAMLGAALGIRPPPSQGLVIAGTLYAAVGGHRDVEEPERDLLRRLGRRRLVRLRTSAIPNYLT
jgi:glycosyltransferase involved in cell wall biosynthesis